MSMKLSVAFSLLLLLFNVCNRVYAQNFDLEIKSNIPDWAVNLKSLYVGDYDSYIIEENPIEKIIGFIGDEHQEPIGLKAPFTNFLFITFNKKDVFLEFKDLKKTKNKYIHTYSFENIKVVIEFDKAAPTLSGNGWGALFKLYYKGSLKNKLKIWSSI